jgi:UDP-N-acetylglucosamine transferase subunit ALG13
VIFVTVGSQEPFDRLIHAIDEWASSRGRSDAFAQIGNSTFRPRHIEFTKFLDPVEFKRAVREAKIIVAHAGMGSIISALELGKPIVVMPRRGKLRETRNDHQVDTAERFGSHGHVIVAQDEHDFAEKLDYALTVPGRNPISQEATPRLMSTIRGFLDGNLSELDPGILVGKSPTSAVQSSTASLGLRTRKA